MDDTLRTCHPAVSFAYFALVIACAMLLMHPVCLVLSTLGGGWYVARLLGGKGLTLGLRLLRAGLQRFQVPVQIVYHFPLPAQNFHQLAAV